MRLKKFLRNNGLSLVFIAMFVLSLVGQFYTGLNVYNKEQQEENNQPVSAAQYISTGHFIQATFENWESEFLQMALFILLTISLRQKGSSESKSIDKEEEVDREPSPLRKGAPWPVKKGGLILLLYKHSLSICFLLLFLLSLVAHFYGSMRDENDTLLSKHLPIETPTSYMLNPRFWFESFQNWQSEFLSVFCIVIFTVFLRQKGSPQSKPVDAADDETGE